MYDVAAKRNMIGRLLHRIDPTALLDSVELLIDCCPRDAVETRPHPLASLTPPVGGIPGDDQGRLGRGSCRFGGVRRDVVGSPRGSFGALGIASDDPVPSYLVK